MICTRCRKADARRHIGRSHFCEPCYEAWCAERCKGQVFDRDGWGKHRCEHKGVEEVAGKMLCKAHATRARDRVKSDREWAERMAKKET